MWSHPPRRRSPRLPRTRKGREDSKDEPGAADFYYGEMEMRRHATRAEAEESAEARHYGHWATATTEHAVLWLYWLTSGYGLRAWRAMAALAVVIGLAGVGFSRVGFHHPHPSQLASWLYALQATVSLEGKPRQLSGSSSSRRILRVGLRFTGPCCSAWLCYRSADGSNAKADLRSPRPCPTGVGHNRQAWSLPAAI